MPAPKKRPSKKERRDIINLQQQQEMIEFNEQRIRDLEAKIDRENKL